MAQLEMRTAKLQTTDLGRTEQFFNTLLSKDDIKEVEKGNTNEAPKHTQINGGSMSFKLDGKPRFSDPPAPPPQQPLPEKPDVIRSHGFDSSTPALKRSTTERPRSVPNVPHERPEPTSQIISLVEALATAKKEIDAQNARMRDLEDMLQKEREARETAETLAKRLEIESYSSKMNGFAKGGIEDSVLEEAFEPPSETLPEKIESIPKAAEELPAATVSVEASTAKLQERLDLMMAEMREMKEHMESYRKRADLAEAERDSDRKTLAEMVEKIRSDEQARRSGSTERGRSLSKKAQPTAKQLLANGDEGDEDNSEIVPLFKKEDTQNDKAGGDSTGTDILENPLVVALSRPPGSDHLIYNSAPYASMLGVVLIGMGLMAYMNGWQKVER
jgi:hypothetical protein